MNPLEIVKLRIKELEEIISMLPVSKTFTAQSRLIEAKHILDLLTKRRNT